MLDDIINRTYDSSEDIPGTYSEAWEQAISDAWQNVVEQSTDSVPGENNSDKPTEGEDTDTEEPSEGEDDNPNIRDIIDRIPDELKNYGKCDEFAQSLANALEEEGLEYQIIRVDSEFGIYSDKAGMSIGDNYHYGIQVGNAVYDNLTPEGVPLDAWLEDLGLTQALPGISWNYVFEIFNQ